MLHESGWAEERTSRRRAGIRAAAGIALSLLIGGALGAAAAYAVTSMIAKAWGIR